MTANELQRIALRLSNSGWCRHWLNFNHPQNPRKMALQVLDVVPNENPIADVEFIPRPVSDLAQLGFQILDDNKDSTWIYTIERTNDDGTPFVSQL